GRHDRARAWHDLPLHARPVAGRLGPGDHRKHPHHRHRRRDLLQHAAKTVRQGVSVMKPSPISPTVDFDRDGVQHGFLKLPYSRDDAAWGAVMIPLTVVRNGSGPTALLTGANHGDEYE